MEDEASVSTDGKMLGNLRVVDLKQELDKRGLSKSGSKKDLVKRLKQQLEFEKLCEERKLSGDCDMKLELDAATEQNEFVQQYLAQQQKIYAEQKELKRVIELEEIQKLGSDREFCDDENEMTVEEKGTAATVEETDKTTVKEANATVTVEETDTKVAVEEADTTMTVEDTDTTLTVEETDTTVTVEETDAKTQDAAVSDSENKLFKNDRNKECSSSDNAQNTECISETAKSSDCVESLTISASSVPSIESSGTKSSCREETMSNIEPATHIAPTCEAFPKTSYIPRKISLSRKKNPDGKDIVSDSSPQKEESHPNTEETAVTPEPDETSDSESKVKSNVQNAESSSSEEAGENKGGAESPSISVPISPSADSNEIDHSGTQEQTSNSEPPVCQLPASENLPKAPYASRRVSLSSTNMKINRKSADERKSDKPKVKKSKWDSFATSHRTSQTINISTDSLKNWFPDFKLISDPVPVSELISDDQPAKEEKVNSGEVMDVDESTVTQSIPSRNEDFDSERQMSTVESPPEQGPVSKILFIRNLVRPFTLNQLKELLKKNGNMIEEHFWIDKIKSKCFVMYETEEEAVKVRNTLNGTRWPSSNPKILSVDFTTEEELEFHKTGNEPPKPAPEPPVENQEMYEVRTVLPVEDHRKKDRDRKKERERSKPQPPMREWDKDKITQESPDRERIVTKDIAKPKSSERKEKKDSKRKANEDTPAKLLDDLFQKTKGSPCIYWLPLSEEQMKQKEEAKRLRRVEREKQNQQQRKQEDTERRNKNARSGRRSRDVETRRSATRSRSPVSRRR